MERCETEMAGSLSAEDFNNRSSARDSLMLAANFRVEGQDEGRVRVRNLSAGGMMAEFADKLERGTEVSVEVRGIGWVDGRIAWSTDGRVGIAFDEAVDPMRARKPVGGGTSTPVYAKPIITRRK